MRFPHVFLPLLLAIPLVSYAAKKPRRLRRALPECLSALNQNYTLVDDYIDFTFQFPIDERGRSAVKVGGLKPMFNLDDVYRGVLHQKLTSWTASQNAWTVWDKDHPVPDIKALNEFPMIAGVVTVERELPIEHIRTPAGVYTRGGLKTITRTYIGVVESFDSKENRVYIRELVGRNQGGGLNIDITLPEFKAYLRPAPR